MSQKYNVAIVGATGAVGETLISILDQRNFPIENLYPLHLIFHKLKLDYFQLEVASQRNMRL